LPLNFDPSGGVTWFAPSGTADETANTDGTPFSSAGGYLVDAVPILAGFDVATPAASYNLVQYPGEPTAVVAGSNVIDRAHASALVDYGNAPSERLAGQLYSQGVAGTVFDSSGGAGGGYGVTDAGIESNMVLKDGDTAGGIPGGPSLLARIDRDILAEPDVGTVIIDEGLQDVLAADGAASTTANLGYAYAALQQQLTDFGVQSQIFGTLTPCGGFTDTTDSQQCDAQVETARNQISDSFTTLKGSCSADLSTAVAANDGKSPADLATAYDTGDHVNLTLGSSGGYAALAQAIANSPCSFMPPSSAPPST
jgi:hypothetical protein